MRNTMRKAKLSAITVGEFDLCILVYPVFDDDDPVRSHARRELALRHELPHLLDRDDHAVGGEHGEALYRAEIKAGMLWLFNKSP